MKTNSIIPFISLMIIVSGTYAFAGQTSRRTTPRIERMEQGKTERIERRVPKEKIRRAPALPDLTIKALTLKRRVVIGEEVTVTAEINSTHALGGVKVRFYLDEKQIGEDSIRSIKPNATQTAQITFTAEDTGKHTITAEVKPDKAITESNDRNNTKGKRITIVPLKTARGKVREKTSVRKLGRVKPKAETARIQAKEKIAVRTVTRVKPSRIPRITSVKPDTLVQGKTHELTIRGGNLDEKMFLNFGPGIQVKSLRVSRSKKIAKLKVHVAKTARSGLRNVVLSSKGKKRQIARVTVKRGPYPRVGIGKKRLARTEAIPKILWLYDFGGTATGSPGTGKFGFKFQFKWKDGDGDLCDGKWYLKYDHDNLNGNFRDLADSGCPPKGFPKASHPGTEGVAEEFMYLKGKDLEEVTLTLAVKDAAGNVSNKVSRKITLVELGGKAGSSASAYGKSSGRGKEIGDLRSQVAAIDKPSGKQPQTIKGAKLKKQPSMVLFSGSGGGSNNADLVVSVNTTNETYQGDGKTLYVEVWNKSSVTSQDFTVGFCLSSQINSKGPSKWLGTKKIQILGPSNQVLVSIPWQVQVLANPKDTFIAMVDIDNTVDEGTTGENNNQTKAFKYETGPAVLIPIPIGKPTEGFQISFPCSNCTANTIAGGTGSIIFGPTSSIMSDPKALALMSDYVRISLLRPDGSEVLTIAENAWFSKNYTTNSWTWLVPSSLTGGKYAIYIKSTDGHYFGKSSLFPILSAPIAISKQFKPKTILGESGMDLKQAAKASKVGHPPPGEIPLEITNMTIKSLMPKTYTLSGGSFGPFARLSFVDIVLEFQANKPFKFADSLNPKDLKPAASWSLVVPEVKVVGYVFPLNEMSQVYPYIDWHSDITKNMYYNYYDPSGSYPWSKTYTIGSLGPFEYPKGIIPKGKSTITLRINNPGVIHGLNVIGLAKGKKEVWVGITKKIKTVWYKCMQYQYPAIGVRIGLEYKATPEKFYSGISKEAAIKSYFFKKPQVVQTLDTTLTTKQLGFVPPWSSPKEFSSKNCEAVDKTLVGGW